MAAHDKSSAYHGGSWKNRGSSHRQECLAQKYWTASGNDSEFAPLREVLLYAPPAQPKRIADPERVQHLNPVNWKKLAQEIMGMERLFAAEGVTVHRLLGEWFAAAPPNLMFIRDHFFATPWGAVLGRMASPIRAGEEKWAQKALADLGIPILALIRGRGTFEGADALWLSPQTVLVGIGNRTNRDGFRQIKKLLAEFQVRVHAVILPKRVQHLLGLLQIVDCELALIRRELAAPGLLKILRAHKFKLIEVPEGPEVTHKQGMNLITLAPRRIMMPANCPGLYKLYQAHGLQVAAEIPFNQGLNAAGGLACATGIISRRISPCTAKTVRPGKSRHSPILTTRI